VADRSSDARIQAWSRGVSCNALFNPASAAFDLTNLTAGETSDADLFTQTQVRPVVKAISRRIPNELSGTIHLSKKTQGVAPDRLREVSLIGLSANLDDPLCHRKLSIIFEKPKSINSAHTQQRRGSRMKAHKKCLGKPS